MFRPHTNSVGFVRIAHKLSLASFLDSFPILLFTAMR